MEFIPEIDIEVQTQFLEGDSYPEKQRFVFAYSITITNHSDGAVQLISRFWHIADANGKIQEVHGEGVVGQQPRIEPGKSFQYTSGAVLETAVGTMEGEYEFVTDNGSVFTAPIPAFTLADPISLH